MATKKRTPLNRNPSAELSRKSAAKFRKDLLTFCSGIEHGSIVGLKVTFRVGEPSTYVADFGENPQDAIAQDLYQPPTSPAVGTRWTNIANRHDYEVTGFAWTAGSAAMGWVVIYRNDEGRSFARRLEEWPHTFAPATVTPEHPDLFATETT